MRYCFLHADCLHETEDRTVMSSMASPPDSPAKVGYLDFIERFAEAFK